MVLSREIRRILRRNEAVFLNGYFYWCGVVANVIVGFWVIVGGVVVWRNWCAERRIRKKYARRNIGGK